MAQTAFLGLAETREDSGFFCECGVVLERIPIVVSEWAADFLVCHGCHRRFLFDAAEQSENDHEAETRTQNWKLIADYLDLDISQALDRGEVGSRGV